MCATIANLLAAPRDHAGERCGRPATVLTDSLRMRARPIGGSVPLKGEKNKKENLPFALGGNSYKYNERERIQTNGNIMLTQDAH